jgi:hypothetical protein
MNKKGANIKTKTNKQDYTVGTVSTFIQKIIETGNRKRLLSGVGTCILIKGGRVILVCPKPSNIHYGINVKINRSQSLTFNLKHI